MASPRKNPQRKKSLKVAAYVVHLLFYQGSLGRHHDLREIFNEVNDQYFHGRVTAVVRWSRRYNRPPRRHRKVHFGDCFWELGKIVIHSTLDRPWVPRWYIRAVMYHEILHIVLPPLPRDSGRRNTHHHSAFSEAEQQFPDYDKAQKWERQHLSRLLRF